MSSSPVLLKKLLGCNSFICVMIAFFACRGLVMPGYALGFLTVLALSVLIDLLKWRRPPRVFINVVSLVAFGTAAATARIDSVVETLTGTVLLMMAVKMLEDKQARDHVQVVVLSAIAVVSAAVLSLRAGFVFYYVIMSYFLCLSLLLCSFFARAPGLTLSRASVWQLFVRALAIWLMMLPICLALFFAAPRARAALALTQYRGGEFSTSGFTDRITHGLIANIQESAEIAFRAEMPQIAQDSLYWRGLVLSSFDGNEWVARNRPDRWERGFTVQGEFVEQHIFLEQGQYRVLFTLDKPLVVNAGRPLRVSQGTYVRAGPLTGRQFQYDVISAVSSSMKPDNPNFNTAAYLALPQGFIPQLRVIVDRITNGKSEGGKIRAILDYLSPPVFAYSLENLPVSRNAVEDFLFNYRRGNCEYFASSMAIMCRMAGIPARLVAGYRGGYYNENGGYYIVRQRNAHAWAEVWDSEEEAWRRYDPTPPNESIESGGGGRAPGRLAMFLDLLNYRVSQVVVEYSGQMQLEIFESLQAFLLNPGASFEPAARGVKRVLRSALYPVLAVAFITGAALLVFLLYRASRVTQEKILLRKFLAAMKKQGHEKHPSEGLEEFVGPLPATKLRELARHFVEVFENDYFRDRPMKEETLFELRKVVKRIRQERG